MSEIFEVIELGNPLLRQRALPVKDAFAPEIKDLIDKMLATLNQQRGVGLAAPQIGVSLQIFIVSPYEKQQYPNTTLEDSLVVINPKIKPISKKKEKDWEGCLSVPGIRGLVLRYQNIEIEYMNRLGEIIIQEYSDFIARIFQHENDHLHGNVFLDRVKSSNDIITEKEYLKLFENLDKNKKDI